MTLGTTWRICIKFTSPVQIEGVWPSVHILADVYVTLHDVLERVSRNPLSSLPVKLGWKGTSVQWKRAAPTEIPIALSPHLCHPFLISLHIPLFFDLSLHIVLPFFISLLSVLSSRCTVCCLWLSVVVCCVLWLDCGCCRGGACCSCGGCVCVSSCLTLNKAPVCTFTTIPCVLSKRPRRIGHGRVLKVHTKASWAVYPSLLVSLSLLSYVSLSPLIALSFCSLSITLNNNDKDRSSSWLSLCTRLYLA